MTNLFLLDGLAGTGKSDCIEYINNNYHGEFETGVIQKYTTRELRVEEQKDKIDLKFITEEKFNQICNDEKENFIKYKYGGKLYGIKKSDIDYALEKCQNVFLIVRNVACIKYIMNIYKNTNVNVVPVFVYTDLNKVVERLKKDGYNEEQIEFRIKRSEQTWEDYLNQTLPLYTDYLINNSNKTHFHLLIEQLMRKYQKEGKDYDSKTLKYSSYEVANLVKQVSGHKQTLVEYLDKHSYFKNIFLMIKYRKNNEKFRENIKNIIEWQGFNCIIANKINLTNDIYNPLALTYCCKYGIAIFDEPDDENSYSPNVAYELGVMQAQDKKCFVIQHESLKGKNFFDLLKDSGNCYSNNDELISRINEWLKTIKDDDKSGLN